MATRLASTVCKGCFSALGSWTSLSLSLSSCWVSSVPSVTLSLLLRRWLVSCFPSSPLVLPPHPLCHCTAFSALFASLLSFHGLIFDAPLYLSLSLSSLILIHNILKERLITLAWPCLTSGEWFPSGSFWCGLCEIDESCSICSSKLCLWKARMHLLGMSLFFFPETRPKDRRNPCYFPCDHHPHRSLNAHKRWNTLHNPPFYFFFSCCYSQSPHVWDFYPQRRFFEQPLIWI